MNSFGELESRTVPISSPTLVLTQSDKVASPVTIAPSKHIQPKLNVLVALIFVLVFVSIAIGMIVWILDHEYTTKHPKKQLLESGKIFQEIR